MIAVTDVNETPYDINLSAESVAENRASGTVVGTITTIDPDDGDTFTYSLVAGTGGTDNASFSISGNSLLTAAEFNHELKSTYNILIRTTDAGGLTYEETFAITVTNVNETPADITLSATSVMEAQPAGTRVGRLTTVDPDEDDTHTYSLVEGTGDTDNSSFTIAGDSLLTAAVFNLEVKSTYMILIRTTDAGGLFYEEAFTITVTDVNEAPVNINLSAASVAENLSSGTTVGTMTTTDPDTGDTHTYSLVEGSGSTDNASFSITGNRLLTAAVFNHELKPAYNIRIRTTDDGGRYYEEAFVIAVTNVNETPYDINLSAESVAENLASGTTVGTLTTNDPDEGDTYTYSLVDGTGDTDNASFSISGNSLLTASVFNYEIKSTYYIRIRTTDAGGLTHEEAFTITVINVNENPTNITLSGSSVNENRPVSTTVGTLTTNDPDVGDTHTYSLVNGTGDSDNASFSITGNSLLTAVIFNYELKSTYAVRIRTTDDTGGIYEETYTIRITNVNEPPAEITLSNSSVAENQVINTIVGTLGTTDPDNGETFTYTLVSGDGDNDNNSFNIAGSSLRTSAIFDYESRNSYSIRVRSADHLGLWYERAFTITIIPVNEAPVDIILSNTQVAENQASGALVGYLTASDPNAGDSHTFTLVPGAGSSDNVSYTIFQNQLRTNASFNYEGQSSYAIRIRATDAGSLYTEKQFTITVTNVNEAPAEINLSATSVAENQPSNTVVGMLSTEDPDSGNDHAYSLVAGSGSDDNSSFNISGNRLRTNDPFNYETKSSCSIRIRTTDDLGLWFEEVFTVTITNINERPTGLALSGASVPESQPVNTVVGNLSTTDPDAGNTFTYTLVPGTGSTGNGSFNISGSSLRTSQIFDYETQNSYSIRLRTTDGGGLYIENVFTITVTYLNQAPTDISLSGSAIVENQPINTLVGNLAVTDPNAGDIHTFTLVSGDGDTDNSSFTIAGNQLRTNAPFDYEARTTYSIRVRATDAGSLNIEKQFTIAVANINEIPTDILLTGTSVPENRPTNTLIGTLSATDQDEEDSHTYSLVTGPGSADNGSFVINANQLRTNAIFNFESKDTYSIRIRATDNGLLYTEKQFTITVTNVNEAPAGSTLSNSSVAESQPVNTVVGTLTTTDPDAENTFTYSLVAGTGSSGNGSFNISGSSLRTSEIFDYETRSAYSIRVRTRDGGGLYVDNVFTITVTFFNQAPTDINLSNASVAENQPSNTLVGNFTTVDPNASDSHTYTLVPGTGSSDNASFTITGNQLRASASFNYEVKASYFIRVRSTDSGSQYAEEQFIISVTNVNEAPSDLSLSNTSVDENRPVNTVVGMLATTDPDDGNIHAYSLVSGPGSNDNGSFIIAGTRLRTDEIFNFESKSSYSIRIRTTDADGLWYEEVFTVTVNNVNESPVGINLSNATIPESQPVNTLVGNLSSTDPDADSSFTYTLVSGAGSSGNSSFIIAGSSLQTNAVFDYETQPAYSIRVRTTDNGGLYYERIFTITVALYNQAPTDILLSNNFIAENQPSNTLVGNLIAVDANASDTHIFTLVSGTGSADNSSFRISQNQLRTNTSFNYETGSTYSIRVRVTDAGSLYTEKQFIITVTDINEAPSDIMLSGSSIAENLPVNTVIGTLSTADPDENDSHIYTLVSGTGSDDNTHFNISGNRLRTDESFNFETASSYTLRLRSTDAGGRWIEKVFIITVTNVNEAPVAIALSNLSVPESQPLNTVVGTLSATDPDNGSTFIYSLVPGTGSSGNVSFNISGSSLRTSAVFDYESQSTYSIRISVTDNEGLSYERTFVITVSLFNQAPTNLSLSNASVAENQPNNTLVGNLAATDPNASDSHTFTLVSGTGSTDNSSFTISNNQLRTRAVFNFESKSSYSIRIRVTDAGGLNFDKNFTIVITNVNEPPVASGVIISRSNNRIGTVNTGTFVYTDPETGDFMEGNHIYKWYRKLPDGRIQSIDSVSAISYTPVMADGGDSICFEVTPRDNLDLLGNPVRSPFVYINAAPAVSNVRIFAPDLRVSRYAYGRFTYSDLENNRAGRHTYQWYRSSTPSGTGALISEATDTIYRLMVTEDSRYIRFVIIPAASVGSTPGAAVSSAWIGPVGSSIPTATISGTDTTCHNGPKVKLTINLTGEPEWTIRYRRVYSGRTEDNTIRNIQYTPFVIDASGDGTYTLLSVSDANYTSGSVSGSAVISYFPAATARLSGTAQICQDKAISVPMTVDFTGTSPWTFILQRNTEDTTYYNITQDPFVFTSRKPGIYKIAGLYDRYCQGDTVAGYGTAVISYITSPKAVISGIDTTCPGDTAVLRVQLEGTGPFSITYLRNGANAKTVSNIRQTNYALKVIGNGTYTLSAVSDQVRSGCISGTGRVVYYTVPTATISGSGNICEHTSASLRVTFTGTPPWNFSYHLNTEAAISVTNVTSSSRNISVTKEGTYSLVNVSDKYCNGTVTGNTTVTVTPAPVVSITGLNPAYSVDETMVSIFGNPRNGVFTPPLIMIHDTNYFLPKLVGAGIHTIIYSYRDPQTGCYGYDTVSVAVLEADAIITFPGDNQKKFFCFNDLPFTILGHNTKNSTGTFTISGGKGLVDNHDNTATIYPSQLEGGQYQVTYRYYNETFLEVKESFEIETVAELRIIGFDKTSYCDDASRVRLNGNITGAVFSGRAVTGNASTGYYFEPKRSMPGMDTVFYTYTTARGCSRQIIRPLIIHDAADIKFTVNDTCFSSSALDSTAFINLTTTMDTIKSWSWNFGDPGSSENSSTLKNPKHRYLRDGLKKVTLIANTNHCESTNSIYFKFGDKPKADFDWATECFHTDSTIRFINRSSWENQEVTIDNYHWKFYTGDNYDSVTTWNAEYQYSDTGNYKVELFIHSNYGCTDKISKTLPLRPTYLLQDGASYFEGFENGRAGWLGVSEDTVNSWTLGQPQKGFNAAAKGMYAWYTAIINERPPKENSAVTSPCFSFSGLQKPMIKMNLWRYFDEYRDGANLQYTADSGKTWVNVGKLNDGINWYNNYEITGNPGGKSTGWSSSNDVQADPGWIEARHSIDELKGKTDVQFRIAYGSDSTAIGTNGLAFDNFWIGDRNKIVLIEHFTNTSDIASMAADSELDELANSNPFDIVDIQYHTSFPGADPFNEQNKVDPGTRVLFYQLSTVPFSIINGGTYKFDYKNSLLDPVMIKNQSLVDPKFNINLETDLQDNSLEVDAEIGSLEPIINHQVTLHIAVIERKISGVTGANGDTLFESVLKIILSSNSFTNNWDPSVDLERITENWNLKNTYNTDEIRVIAFIQDEVTHEIYQAMIDKFDVRTALENEHDIHRSTGNNSFIAFPNPVNNEIFIRFDEALIKNTRADLFDINGKLIMTKELFAGFQLHAITMEDFPEGFYFMRITSDNQFIGLQKLVISR